MSAPPGSLTTVVSDLIRASYGASGDALASTDLDQYVAEMLLADAKAMETRAAEYGVGAWTLDEEEEKARKPKTNKRFLTNTLRNVEEHNENLKKVDIHAARERERKAREERMGMSDAERRLRQQGKLREADSLKTRERSRRDDERSRYENVSRDRSRSRDRSKRKERSRSRERSSRSRRDTSAEKSRRREASPDRSRRKDISPDRSRRRDNSKDRSRRRDRSKDRSRNVAETETSERPGPERSASTEREHRKGSRHTRDRSKSPRRSRRHKEDDERTKTDERDSREHRHSKSRRSEHTNNDHSHTTTETHRNASPGPSKMDKYFAKDYDPALDTNVEDLTDPNTGLIAEGNLDHWSQMLDLLQKRKEDKVFGVTAKRKELREEEERLKKDSKRRKKRRDSPEPTVIEPTVNVGGHTYVRKGGVREWDQGKETPT